METGQLTARVYTTEAQIPIQGASVTVNRINPDGTRSLIGVRETDRNGKTEEMTIEAPDREDSRNQNSNDKFPFADCNIKVDKDGYDTVIIRNVQVFAGVRTIQNVEMIPLEENLTAQESIQEFNVTPQNL